jgi:hypothetical protein
MSDTDAAADPQPATVEGQLRLGTGFNDTERPKIVELYAKLDKRLKRWSAEQVDMELSIKERETPSQSLTLECWIAAGGNSRFVATSSENALQDALMDCREDLWRQIDEYVSRKTDGRKR